MESTKVIGYRDAFQTLTNRDLAQSLYDESAIIMQDVILTTDGNEHVKRRKTEFHVFRKEISKKYEKYDFPNILNPILDEAAFKGNANLVELGHIVTMNVTADIAGIDRPLKSKNETENLLRLVKIFSEGATLVHSLKNKEIIKKKVFQSFKEFDKDFYISSFERRKNLLNLFKKGENNEDELPKDILMILLINQDKLKLSNDVIKREVAFYLQAGSHSTANASVHAFHEIIEWKEKHPEDKFKLSNDMFFLQKCVFETLRLHPASPVAWRKAKCPVHLSNLKTVNEGDNVVIDLLGSNRDKSIFGEDAEQFNPHRKILEKFPPWGLSFGVGVHACLGRTLDGGEIPDQDSDPSVHNYGLITHFIKGLLDRDAEPSKDNPPVRDLNTQRPNWGSYSITFRS